MSHALLGLCMSWCMYKWILSLMFCVVDWDVCCDVCCVQQIMSVGGNGRARQFFKQHGWSELGADKIEQKVWLPARFNEPSLTAPRWTFC